MTGQLATQSFRDEHAELLTHIDGIAATARALPNLSPSARGEAVGRVLDFLRHTLIPHAEAEEAVPYPEWAALVGSPEAAEPMVHDHRAIVARATALAETDPEDIELLYGLHALIEVHFRKEEDIQLPTFDAQPPQVVERVLARMGEHARHLHR
jgi:Hemerythrin HHE cation binding domain